MKEFFLDEEADEQLERKLEMERAEARQILMDSGLVTRVAFTDCMIPLQIDAFLPTGEMCYGRNSRVGGDAKMWVFETECDLSKGWPPFLFKGELSSDARDYKILAREMVVLITQYLEYKTAAQARVD